MAAVTAVVALAAMTATGRNRGRQRAPPAAVGPALVLGAALAQAPVRELAQAALGVSRSGER